MAQTTSTLIGTHSEWVGSSQMRCQVRRTKGNLIVEVIELAPSEITHKEKAFAIAVTLAVLNGGRSQDSVELVDATKDRQAHRLDKRGACLVRARQMTWAFKLK